ncbi:type II toxin-antitoxin system RelE/ParE family toxin [Salinisphaera sp. RV14]|uniref:type II toxin-antitoxin system RelE/ParE family toxin n=1 Tax=unclassified Salinisphaera TaxID=2649847 RepID=UPI003F87CE32
MIKSFKHKGLKKFFETGSKAGIQAQHANRLRLVLGLLDAATKVGEMDVPSLRLHSLSGDRADMWAVSVSGNWRITFRFEGENVYIVNYEDYH